VSSLAALPAWVLVLGWCAFTVAVAFASRWLIGLVVPDGDDDHVRSISAPLMPALGAAFAVLIAITLSSEAGYLRSAQDLVSNEAAQASRLAWAATSPEVDTEPIQEALGEYLAATRTAEWHGRSSSEPDDVATSEALAHLERVVRTEAARTDLGTPASSELLAALDGVSTARRARLAAESRDLPGLYVVTLVASGIALVVNAGALTFRSSTRTSLLVVGLAVVVGLCLALLFALSGPWEGALTVSGGPIDLVRADLRSGFFTS
jgi:hypothetical protein